MDEKSSILGSSASTTSVGAGGGEARAVYYNDGQSPSHKRWQVVSMVIVVLATLSCFGICIYQGVQRQVSHIAFLYFMFAATLLGVSTIHIIMVVLIRRGNISGGKQWFTYVSAFIVVVQSILISIVVFEK